MDTSFVTPPTKKIYFRQYTSGMHIEFEYSVEEPVAPQKKVNRKLSFSDNTDENAETTN